MRKEREDKCQLILKTHFVGHKNGDSHFDKHVQ